MNEKLLQIRTMIQEKVRGTLDEKALEILAISAYALYLYSEPLIEVYLPIFLENAEFIVGKENICTLFANAFGRVEHQLDKEASSAYVCKYTYEEETETMYVGAFFLFSTQLRDSAEAIVRTCSELLHFIRRGGSKIVGEKVRTINGINVDIIDTDKMEIRRKHMTFENAVVQLFANNAVQTLVKEISLLTNKELQAISPLLARFKHEASTYPYDIYAYETRVIWDLCICPSLAQALDLSFSEDKDVSTFAERFNSIFGSSSAFLKFSKALDEVAAKGEEASDSLRLIQQVLLRVREQGFLEVVTQAKETLKK